jgi:hypothetical protein
MTPEHHDYLFNEVEQYLKKHKTKPRGSVFQVFSDSLFAKFQGSRIEKGELFRSRNNGPKKMKCRRPFDFPYRTSRAIETYILKNEKPEFLAMCRRILGHDEAQMDDDEENIDEEELGDE